MEITIEESTLTTKVSGRTKKEYQTQTAYAHLVNTDGSPKRYPSQIEIFPNRDKNGVSVPYAKGRYKLSPTSFEVDNYGNLKLNFINLDKVG